MGQYERLFIFIIMTIPRLIITLFVLAISCITTRELMNYNWASFPYSIIRSIFDGYYG